MIRAAFHISLKPPLPDIYHTSEKFCTAIDAFKKVLQYRAFVNHFYRHLWRYFVTCRRLDQPRLRFFTQAQHEHPDQTGEVTISCYFSEAAGVTDGLTVK